MPVSARSRAFLVAGLALVVSLSVGAQIARGSAPKDETLHADTPAQPATTMATPALAPAPDDVASAIRNNLGAAMKGANITAVETTPIPGVYAVELDSAETAFVNADGTYLISGDLYHAVAGKGLENLTEQRKGEQRRVALLKVDPAKMITFAAKGQEKSALYVFTDVDCGYCRKLHQDVPQLNAAGITIHYLAFPRSGTDGDTAHKMDAVWCAVDRQKAITDSKRGDTAPPARVANCKSPVAEEYRLGVAMGVRGTPAVFDPTGEQIGGYLPPDKLIQDLVGNTP